MDHVRNLRTGKEGYIVHDLRGEVSKTGKVSVLYTGDHFPYSEKRSELELITDN